jgi:hypothetical protein
MRRLFLVVVGSVAGVAVAVPSAYGGGGSPHFIGQPTCSKNSRTFVLTCSGKAAGLDSSVTEAFLTASSVTEHVICVNHGGNTAPGQGTSETSVTGPSQTILPHNGQVTFSVTLNPPPKPTPAQAGCPNNNWTVRVLSVTYNDVTLHIQQGVPPHDGLTFSFGTIDP